MAILDYKGPHSDSPKRPMHGGCAGGLIGAGALGCLVPLVLAVYCALVLDDMGGLLFWPIVVIFGGMVGLVLGAIAGSIVHTFRRRRDQRIRLDPTLAQDIASSAEFDPDGN